MTQLDLQQRLEQVEKERDAECRNWEKQCAGLVKERDTLQQQVNALATEALYLKDEIVQHSQSTHFCNVCGEGDPCVDDDVCWALTHETPATDAIKRQWMAEGVEYTLNIINHTVGRLYADSVKETLSDVAAQLRQPEEKGQ